MKKLRVAGEWETRKGQYGSSGWGGKVRFYVKDGENPKSAISKAVAEIDRRAQEKIDWRIHIEGEARAEEEAEALALGPVVAIVTTWGGGKSEYHRGDVQGWLDNKSQITMSDNLPKWLWEASNMASLNDPSWGRDDVPGFPGANDNWNEIWKFLEKVKGASKPVQINVQSDDRSKNRIKF